MQSEQELLKMVEKTMLKLMEVQKLNAKLLVKMHKQQEKLLDVFERAEENLGDV